MLALQHFKQHLIWTYRNNVMAKIVRQCNIVQNKTKIQNLAFSII